MRAVLQQEVDNVQVSVEANMLQTLLPFIRRQTRQATQAELKVVELERRIETLQQESACAVETARQRELNQEQTTSMQRAEISTLLAKERAMQEQLDAHAGNLTQARATEASLRDRIQELQLHMPDSTNGIRSLQKVLDEVCKRVQMYCACVAGNSLQKSHAFLMKR